MIALTDAYDFGVAISQDVAKKIKGRSVIEPHDAGIIAQAIVLSKHGNHVEVGSLFGASAIIAALTKKEFGLVGEVHCIDPLNTRPTKKPDGDSGIVACKDLIMENASLHGVANRIVVHEDYSDPWPINGRFATGFIDGDHWNDMPLTDWRNMESRVSHIIIFHDYCRGKPDVIRACLVAAQDPEWIPIHIGGLTFVVRRRE